MVVVRDRKGLTLALVGMGAAAALITAGVRLMEWADGSDLRGEWAVDLSANAVFLIAAVLLVFSVAGAVGAFLRRRPSGREKKSSGRGRSDAVPAEENPVAPSPGVGPALAALVGVAPSPPRPSPGEEAASLAESLYALHRERRIKRPVPHAWEKINVLETPKRISEFDTETIVFYEEIFRDRVRLLLGSAKEAGFDEEQTAEIRKRPRKPSDIPVLVEALRAFARLAGFSA